MDRRTLMKRTVVGGAAIAVGGGTLLALQRGPAVDGLPSELHALDADAFRVLVAIAEVAIPTERARAIETVTRVDTALTYGSPRATEDLKMGLILVENALLGVFIRRQVTPFSALDTKGREDALATLRDSPSSALRGAYHALRRLCIASYYAGPREAKETGYPGAPFEKPDPPPISPRLALSPAFVVTARAAPAPIEERAAEPEAPIAAGVVDGGTP